MVGAVVWPWPLMRLNVLPAARLVTNPPRWKLFVVQVTFTSVTWHSPTARAPAPTTTHVSPGLAPVHPASSAAWARWQPFAPALVVQQTFVYAFGIPLAFAMVQVWFAVVAVPVKHTSAGPGTGPPPPPFVQTAWVTLTA